MFKYFDKNFLKFFISFIAIIFISCLVILSARLYEENSKKIPDSVNTAKP